LIATLGAVSAWPLAARSQQSAVPVIGFLSPRSPETAVQVNEAFRQGLREAGFVEGQNVAIEYRFAAGRFDLLPALAADLVSRRVPVIAAPYPSGRAAKAATSSIPIVFIGGSDPVVMGLVASVNRPGGNVTGVSLLAADLETKRIGLLREIAPKTAIVGALMDRTDPSVYPETERSQRELQAGSRSLGVSIDFVTVGADRDLDTAFDALVRKRIDAFLKENGDRGIVSPDEVRFVTYTTRYNRCFWVTVDGLEQHLTTSVGISTTTGDGGMLDLEREASDQLVYQVLPSRYGFNPHHLRMANAAEIVIGQGAKPGTGGVLLGAKVSPIIAEARTLPPGVDQRSPCRHPDFVGPDDLQIKIEELREATDGAIPIYIKIGACRVADDVKLACKAGTDVIVMDGLEGGTGASPDSLMDHTGIPTMAALVEAVAALREMELEGVVNLIISGGIRNGVDAAKALALGADAVYIATAAMVALNCNAPLYEEDYAKLGVTPGTCRECHTGLCPVGVTTQDPELMARLDVDSATERVVNFLNAMTMEIQMLARACGKSDVHNLEPEDLRSLTLEAEAITGVPLVGRIDRH
jgi:hypothetical protein